MTQEDDAEALRYLTYIRRDLSDAIKNINRLEESGYRVNLDISTTAYRSGAVMRELKLLQISRTVE